MHGIVDNNPANDPDKKPIKSRSKFSPNYSLFQTALFGYNSPMAAMEVVPDDKVSIRVASDVDTFTLKAPLMAPVKMNKDYFYAPMRALLPKNSERLITNPLTGDDIDPRLVNAVCEPWLFYNSPGTTTSNYVRYLEDIIFNRTAQYQVNYANLGEQVRCLALSFINFYQWTWFTLSKGAPARSLGYDFDLFAGNFLQDSALGAQTIAGKRRISYDKFCDAVFKLLKKYVRVVGFEVVTDIDGDYSSPTVTTKQVSVYPGSTSEDLGLFPAAYTLHQFIELIQQGAMVVKLTGLSLNAPYVSGDPTVDFGTTELGLIAPSTTSTYEMDVRLFTSPDKAYPFPEGDDHDIVNLLRLAAYQLACAQFYTNDSVDYIYSPELWHENQLSLFRVAWGLGFPTYEFYQYNGMNVPYDSISANILESVFVKAYQALDDYYNTFNSVDYPNYWMHLFHGLNLNSVYAAYSYLINLFGFTRSLRYRDYFVGSKTRPMAVGNVDVTVSGGQFSVVDVTKNIQRQRFLNQVNRIGRSLKEYTRGIFGADPTYDPHQLIFLGSSTDVIGAEETQNTAENQYSPVGITSKLRNDSSRFAFEGSFNEFGIIVGIMNFDIVRPMVHGFDRQNLHLDRFDMFNPYLQTIGDQEVKGTELSINLPNKIFGYQLRYSEYKQRFDVAAGGFAEHLPGYCFTGDFSNLADRLNPDFFRISPDFIRNHTFDFDRLYLMLPDDSPAGYFHFIVRHDITIDATRPMLAAPSIL